MIGIYKITSPSGKIYIGQSVNIDKRFKGYFKMLDKNKTQIRLHRSFIKYGVDIHIFEVVEECLLEELNIKERYYQDLYNSTGLNGLNCMLTRCLGKTGSHSKESIEKIRAFNLGKTASIETRLKMSISLKGRIFSENHKKNLSISKMGIKFSEKHRGNMGKSRIGLPAKNRKIVLDTQFGIFYDSVTEASLLTGIDKSVLIGYLKKRVKNKTSLIYC